MEKSSRNAEHLIPSVKRTRRYLTEKEVEKLMDAARKHGRSRPRMAPLAHRGSKTREPVSPAVKSRFL
jgi:hypothetical protein